MVLEVCRQYPGSLHVRGAGPCAMHCSEKHTSLSFVVSNTPRVRTCSCSATSNNPVAGSQAILADVRICSILLHTVCRDSIIDLVGQACLSSFSRKWIMAHYSLASSKTNRQCWPRLPRSSCLLGNDCHQGQAHTSS